MSVKGYSLKEVSKSVGRSEATIVRWMDLKKVKVVKKKNVQGHYFFTEGDLIALKSYNDKINTVG